MGDGRWLEEEQIAFFTGSRDLRVPDTLRE